MFHCLERGSRCRKQRKLPNHGLVQGSKFKSHHGEKKHTVNFAMGILQRVCVLVPKASVSMCTEGKDACM
jgi:hypothetical protein